MSSLHAERRTSLSASKLGQTCHSSSSSVYNSSSRSTTTAKQLRRSSSSFDSNKSNMGTETGSSSNKMWTSNAKGGSEGMLPFRSSLGPLFLLLFCPTFIMTLHHVLVNLNGQFGLFWTELQVEGPLTTLQRVWPPLNDSGTWLMIFGFMAFELILMKLVPGRRFSGPTSPSGHVPEYTANGMQCYFITLVVFLLGVRFDYWSGGVIYDHIGRLLASLNVFALGFCTMLYLKGIYMPSTADSGSSGNFIFDFFWGTELYPRILGWDVKQFTNCRCGMMFWPLMVISCAMKQYELTGVVSYGMWVTTILQLVYITKFYWWESGYMCSIDIMHDRAGFYICWGVLVWLPCLYTSHSMFLAENSSKMHWTVALGVLVLGLLMVYVNYDSDYQRQYFRSVNGNCKIWGRDPFFIEARYMTESGERKSSLLLGSGWWGLSRHFHYIPEILASACWTIPVWTPMWLPYVYVPYLTILLVDRAVRDDARCRAKYGKYWDSYCKQVPYMIIPGIF